MEGKIGGEKTCIYLMLQRRLDNPHIFIYFLNIYHAGNQGEDVPINF